MKLGRAEYRSGEIKGNAESVILALETKGHVSEQLRERIFEERDVSLLEDWLRLAIEEDTIEAFMEKAEMKKI